MPNFEKLNQDESVNDSINLDINSTESLAIHGKQGEKSYIEVENPRHSEERAGVEETMRFVSKRFHNREDAIRSVTYTNTLRKKGFPVPNTTRYYEIDGQPHILMTDATEGGRFNVWGISGGGTTDTEQHVLEEMRIGAAAMQSIKEQVISLVKKGIRENVNIQADFFHLKKIKNGDNPPEVIFLDIEQPDNYEGTLSNRDKYWMKFLAAGFLNNLEQQISGSYGSTEVEDFA